MMFFEKYNDFMDVDPRKDRALTQVNAESMTKRCEVTIPKWLVEGKTILDLGCCYGAYGQWALMHGAKHYTGVELQKKFVNPGRDLLNKYHDESKFSMIEQDAAEFLEQNNQKYDIIIAAGVIHGYTDVIHFLKLISEHANEYVLIESIELPEPHYPRIEFKPYRMVIPKINDSGLYRYSEGMTPIAGFKAVTLILNEYGFENDGGRIKPEKINTCQDIYNSAIDDAKTNSDPTRITANRFISRYVKSSETKKVSLQHKTEKNNGNFLPKPWKFDDDVAKRFQREARTNIPDYDRVIGMCLALANKKFDKTCSVIDVGSALGYTIDVFTKDGFKTVSGVDNSKEMINHCPYKNFITLSDKLPKGNYDLVLANWTLHFVNERKQYIQDVYDSLSANGTFILSEKTTQSDDVKELYYDFKRNNGITDEYIYEKEEKLKGYMNLMPVEWYLQTLGDIGFKSIQIINSRLGFVTFYCNK